MPARPHDSALKADDSLVFSADLHAFAPIGRQYAEVEDARLGFEYPREVFECWKTYVDAVQQATADAISGHRAWPDIVAEMSQRFPERFPQSLDFVPPRMLKTRETPEGRKEYLEWLAQNARFFLLSKESHAPRDVVGDRPDSPYVKRLREKRADLLPPGRYQFNCGDRSRPTQHQKALFDRLESGQLHIFQEVAKALREFYSRCRGHCGEPIDLYDQVLFPGEGSEDISLDCFRIRSFLLHPSVEQIGLEFDSLFDWCDEHGCAVLVSDGKVGEYGWGGGEVLFDLVDELSADAEQGE